MYLLRGPDGGIRYLCNNKEYVVGRKNADILITNDQSISRKHAVFNVKKDNISITDCGATYHTFVDDVKLESNKETFLEHKHRIKFGALQSTYTLECINLVTTSSGMNAAQKRTLEEKLNLLGGIVVSNWSDKCTHLTVDEVLLTVKFLCAIIEGKPIVTLKFWEEYADKVENNLCAPDVQRFKVVCSEQVLGSGVSFDYDERRKTIFHGKVFVFATRSDKAKMDYLISLAGGRSLSFDQNPITVQDMKKSTEEYIIMQSPNVNSVNTDILNYLKAVNKRTIPFQEVALAIMNCSCEKDCNPSFNRTAKLLEVVENPKVKTQTVFAAETQSQCFIEIKEEIVIPETLEPPKVARVAPVDERSPFSSKRRAEDSLEPNITDSLTKKSRQTSNEITPSNPFSSFSYRNKPTTTVRDENVVENPFAKIKKTKALEDVSNVPAKKAKIMSSTVIKMEEPPSFPFELSEILPIDENQQSACQWLSKSVKKESTTNISKALACCLTEKELDEIKDFVNSFQSCVVIEQEDLEIQKTLPPVANQSFGNKSNFKKFKKVKPLHAQTRIIPKSEFETVVCNKTADIVIPSDSEDSGVEELSIVSPKKSKGKQYLF